MRRRAQTKRRPPTQLAGALWSAAATTPLWMNPEQTRPGSGWLVNS